MKPEQNLLRVFNSNTILTDEYAKLDVTNATRKAYLPSGTMNIANLLPVEMLLSTTCNVNRGVLCVELYKSSDMFSPRIFLKKKRQKCSIPR